MAPQEAVVLRKSTADDAFLKKNDVAPIPGRQGRKRAESQPGVEGQRSGIRGHGVYLAAQATDAPIRCCALERFIESPPDALGPYPPRYGDLVNVHKRSCNERSQCQELLTVIVITAA